MAISCDVADLSTASVQLQGIPPGRKLDVLIYLFCKVAMLSCNAESLLAASKCLWCIPDGRKLDVLNYLACQIANGGGTGGTCLIGGIGPPAVPVPCDFSAYIELPDPYGLWLGTIAGGWVNFSEQGNNP